MPTRVIPFAVAALVAAGIVVYQNREQILEMMERGRQKLKESLNSLADTVAKQKEHPYGPRRRSSSDSHNKEYRKDSFDQALRREEEAEGFPDSSAVASGHSGRRSVDGIRQRGVGGEKQSSNTASDVYASVLFDVSTNGGIPLDNLGSRSSAANTTDVKLSERELPPPPLPPRRPITPPPVEDTPAESGYETAQSDGIALGSLVATPTVGHHDSQSSFVPVPHSPKAPSALSLPQSQPVVPPIQHAARVPEIPELPQLEAAQPPSATSGSTPSSSTILPPFESTTPYWSIHEWQNNTRIPSAPASPSLAGSAPEEIDLLDNADILSDFGSDAASETSWTEVGSSISENE